MHLHQNCKDIYETRIRKYKAMTSHLNKCPSFKWHSEGICSNVKCAHAILSGQQPKTSASMQCLSCAGSHSFTCGRFVCTVDKPECDRFKSKLGGNKNEQVTLRSCQKYRGVYARCKKGNQRQCIK